MKIIVSTKYGLARFEQDTVVFTDSIEEATAFNDRNDAIQAAAQHRLKNAVQVEVAITRTERVSPLDWMKQTAVRLKNLTRFKG